MEQLFTRRHAIALGGAAGASLVAARLGVDLNDTPAEAQTPSCVLTGARTEGPYFNDVKLKRSDIRIDPSDGTTQDGVPLVLTLTVVNAAAGCTPVAGATVDLWHANADGKYSGESSEGTSGKNYLRGYQVTDANGQVKFTTIYPGWYSGRAIHMHYKVRVDGLEFTSQLFFDEGVNTVVNGNARYDDRGTRNTLNSNDNIYGNDGTTLVVPLTADGSGGYTGAYTIGLSGTGTTTSDTVVSAALVKTSWRRTARGTRILGIKLDAGERIVVTARLIRDGEVLARKKTSILAIGSRLVNLSVPAKYGGGSARLKLTVQDTKGNKKTVNRTVTIPKKAS